ncbi:hypothetical protein [Aquimarina muelleri]|uniref:Uncharacterized protein n=1 Tax=Aquimarina muelleri TaxID=279356 RepID=A0A918JTL2_9FLAO|nr:hypothetical protein [Aquimarina muelleri]MCX2761963.1 hypothetical protein [Aquimarina muelleri]GGX10710.1 hypothetical protein GCM10007384_10550 [Aquimarina muelleri]
MKRPQSISVIFALVALVFVLTAFKTEDILSQREYLKEMQITDDQKDHGGLVGTWIKQDDPETILVFSLDFTLTEKSKEKTTQNTWSVNSKDREVCIGTSDCIYYDVTELALFLYIDDKIVAYNRDRK